MDMDEGTINFVLQEWFQLSHFKRDKPTKLVRKVFERIIENPAEPKFRSLGTAKLTQKWGPEVFLKAQQIFQAAGAVLCVNNKGAQVLKFNAEDTTQIEVVLALFNDQAEAIEAEMEAKRQAIKNKTKAKLSKVDALEARKKAEVQEKLKLGREEFDSTKRHEPTKGSKAVKRKFGAKHVKVDFETKGG